MTAVAVAVILAFGAGALEGLMRGGGVACAWEATIAGFLIGGCVAAVVGVAWLVRRGLRVERAWALAMVVATGVFVAGEFAAARWLALRFRDPTLVALVAAVGGVLIAGGCVAVVVPVVVRGVRWCERRSVSRWVRAAGVGLGIVGAAALVDFVGQSRAERPRSELVVRAIGLAEAITDVDGDGSGLVLAPRDCAPLTSSIDGARCSWR